MTDKKTILLVDDDIDFIFQQRVAFEAAGYTVLEANTRADAMTILESETPDAAVLDLMMGEKDCGFILAHHVKKISPGTPVVLVTAVTAETGLKFGVVEETDRQWIKADVVLAKPVRFEQLQAEVERLLNAL
jgi:CheY-like chemotaxis protein